MTNKPVPRGIRNHNPGNIRHGQQWQGMAAQQTDDAFAQFQSAEFGIRALAKVLLTYQRKHNLRTVHGIISRWAPPNENDTEAYINSVAKAMHVRPDEPVDLKNAALMMPMVRAIISHENGQQPYTADEIFAGIRKAGFA